MLRSRPPRLLRNVEIRGALLTVRPVTKSNAGAAMLVNVGITGAPESPAGERRGDAARLPPRHLEPANKHTSRYLFEKRRGQMI